MSDRAQYTPGPARGARIHKEGENWTLVLVRDLSHPPELVWQALTEPEHLRQWAPFDADTPLSTTGAKATLTTVGAPRAQAAETTVTRAEQPRLLEYNWGGQDLRWQLEAQAGGTRLTLWHNIDRRFIAWGAAGWHICFDVLDHLLAGQPLGRMVGMEVMNNPGWQRLTTEYGQQFGVEAPGWQSGATKG